MAGSDVKGTYLTASGTISAGPARLCAIHYHGSGGSTGKLDFRDGGASGSILFSIDVHSNSTGQLDIPDEGVRFGTDIYVTFTNMASATVFYK